MSRSVLITGLGPISGLGLGIESTWQAVLAGESAIKPITRFDASAFASSLGCEVPDFDIRKFVPKTYRKATKVMARDIEMAIVAAHFAAHDAKLTTAGTIDPKAVDPKAMSYPSQRIGCHVGAGFIAADLDELANAFVQARNASDEFDINLWGKEGMTHLTPLWLLKYLPNMLACHMTIIHQAQGPSNTITCAEASSELSIGESLQVIKRNKADLCFCGGSESKINPMGLLRQILTGLINPSGTRDPKKAIRPFSQSAQGTILGEGGAILTLEEKDHFLARQANDDAQAYGELVGFAARQTINPADRNLKPDRQGKAISLAINSALADAGIDASAIDMVVPFGFGQPDYDRAEAAGLRTVFGNRLEAIPICANKSFWGSCGAGSGALNVAFACKALKHQVLPAVIHCDDPLQGLMAHTRETQDATLNYVLVYGTSIGGQNAALIIKRFDAS